jgi:CRP/FNR family transcriptional regulator, cyclic AMP receptor protein
MRGKNSEEQARIHQLAKVARFSTFTDAEIDLVIEAASYLTVPDHWALMVEQTPADKAYLILSGEVSVKQHGTEVTRLGPGEVIGEMALVNHNLRSATVIAETPLEVLHFTDETVATLVQKIPHFQEALTGATIERSLRDAGT